MWWFKRPTTELKVVQDEHLATYLKSLGIYEEIISGNLNCASCGKVISLENLQALFPLKEDIGIICSNISCLRNLQDGNLQI